MSDLLHIADGVELPLELVTESNAIIAKKGAGKTNAALVLIEEIYGAGAPVVSIDPKGDHWGIRAGIDGGADGGLPIPVFGGLHGDIPLEPTAGEYIADLVRDRGLSVVLDVSEFTASERRRFLTAFVARLFKHPSRDPMHLFLEEAHEYIPQRVDAGDAAMVGAFERLVKLGRSRGIGVTMISQRSASLNKNVLTQVDNLFVMRTVSPQDRDAVKAWIDTHADSRDILNTLPGLQTGEAWLWQPERGEPLRFRFRMRRTYDAGTTPKLGEKPRKPVTLADLDLGEIQEAMADSIEKANAHDPKLLQARIRELEKQLRDRPTEAREVRIEVPVDVPVISEADRLTLIELDGALHGLAHLLPQYDDIKTRTAEIGRGIPAAPVHKTHTQSPLAAPSTPDPAPTPAAADLPTGEAQLTKQQSAMLGVLAQFPTLSSKQLAMRSGYSAKSSAFSPAMRGMADAGYVKGDSRGWSITDYGRDIMGTPEAVPTGRALIQHWVSRLKPMEGRMLQHLVDVWPAEISATELAEATGYSITSSAFSPAISALKSFDLATGTKDALAAADTLGEARDA